MVIAKKNSLHSKIQFANQSSITGSQTLFTYLTHTADDIINELSIINCYAKSSNDVSSTRFDVQFGDNKGPQNLPVIGLRIIAKRQKGHRALVYTMECLANNLGSQVLDKVIPYGIMSSKAKNGSDLYMLRLDELLDILRNIRTIWKSK